MSETPDSLILNLFRAIRSAIIEVKACLDQVKKRPGILEAQYSSLCRHPGLIGGDRERAIRRTDLADA